MECGQSGVCLEDRLLELTSQLEKLRIANGELREENDALKLKLGTVTVEVGVQTEDEAKQSLSEELADAARDALGSVGYVYDERTGLYYDTKSGYYYDPQQQLFYEPRSGVYYTYDDDTKSYSFHSKADFEQLAKQREDMDILAGLQHKPPTCSSVLKSGDISESDSDTEEGEVTSDGELPDVVEIERSPEFYPPCVRMVVTSSEHLTEGSLLVVTVDGGTIGRETSLNPLILIPDLSVSKVHCEVVYDSVARSYFVIDKASETGTFVNKKRVCQDRKISDPFPLLHRDHLTVGSTTFRCHIHADLGTCFDCEPVVRRSPSPSSPPVSQTDRHSSHRQRLKQIKARYCLTGFESVKLPKGYSDKAAKRRQTVGSDNPYEPDAAPISAEVPLEQQEPENKGAKMLAKMGWKSGQSLGTGSSGLTTPLSVTQRSNQRAGLGASDNATSISCPPNTSQQKKMRINMITKERFDKITSAEPDS